MYVCMYVIKGLALIITQYIKEEMMMMLKIKMAQRLVAGVTSLLGLIAKVLLISHNKQQQQQQGHHQMRDDDDDDDDDDDGDERFWLSWRLGVETINVSPWRTVPAQCFKHLEKYMKAGGQYEEDMRLIVDQIIEYASHISLSPDAMDAWILDVDDTCISNLPYYQSHRFGCDPFDSAEFKAWIKKGMCPANHAVLKLFNKLKERGFKVFLLTGRDEATLGKITTDNLHSKGFFGYQRLILRSGEYKGQSAVRYKSAKRKEIEGEGYRIWGNVGDQWSDLQGDSLGTRTFKLPNPMYFIS